MSFRNCGPLTKMSPAQEKPGRKKHRAEARCYTPQVQTPGCPGQARGWAATYIEEESRDWCEALYMNQAQTVREVSFPGSNIKKPKKKE